jgi:thymidylate kinase
MMTKVKDREIENNQSRGDLVFILDMHMHERKKRASKKEHGCTYKNKQTDQAKKKEDQVRHRALRTALTNALF